MQDSLTYFGLAVLFCPIVFADAQPTASDHVVKQDRLLKIRKDVPLLTERIRRHDTGQVLTQRMHKRGQLLFDDPTTTAPPKNTRGRPPIWSGPLAVVFLILIIFLIGKFFHPRDLLRGKISAETGRFLAEALLQQCRNQTPQCSERAGFQTF